jgi:hypothetical protein
MTSAVRVCLCFHSLSRFKNHENLKFLYVSSMHQYKTISQGFFLVEKEKTGEYIILLGICQGI